MGLFDRLRGDDDERVVFLGIDGVPYDLVQNHPDVFENLTDIAETGSAGRLESIVPPSRARAGRVSRRGKIPARPACTASRTARSTPTRRTSRWGNTCRRRGCGTASPRRRDATVLNVPVTFPPSSRIQRQVSGFLSPSIDAASSDDSVRQVLEDHDYRIDVNAKLGHDDDKTEFIENAHATLDARHDVFTHYLDQDDWDLFFGVFMSTDRVNHFLFGDYANDGEYKDDFLDFYRTLDGYIGEIRDALDDDTTLIVASDHGFTELVWEVNCNQFLADEGWLSYDGDDHDSLADIDDEARAYSLIPGRFYLNLEGREPEGVVPESEYEAVREELRTDLDAHRPPTAGRCASGSWTARPSSTATTTRSRPTSWSSPRTAST